MNQHRQAPLIDLGPNGRKHRIGEAFARNIGQHHHTACTVAASAIELFNGPLGILPGQRREPPNAIGIGRLRLGHGVIGFTRCAAADLFIAPVHIGTSERHHRDVNASGVHVLDAQVVIEVSLLRNDHGGVPPENFLLTVWPCFDVVLATFGFQQLQPLGGKHVRVNIND